MRKHPRCPHVWLVAAKNGCGVNILQCITIVASCHLSRVLYAPSFLAVAKVAPTSYLHPVLRANTSLHIVLRVPVLETRSALRSRL